MGDRTHGPTPVTSLRVGRTDVGAATAMIDDDALTLIVRVESEERPLRLRFSSIDSMHAGADEIDLVVRDGTHVVITASAELRNELLGRCRSLPEMTRTLRAFGSSRARRATGRSTDASEQQRFFAPFLDARRSASSAEGDAAIRAFNGLQLADALTKTLQQFAADRQPDAGPERRALEAELIDASEPLFDALRVLGEAADAAVASSENLRLWRAWSARLRTTFEVADRVWMAVDETLDAAHRQAELEASRKTRATRKAR